MIGKTPPTISIGLPVRNGQKYLREALDSLSAQQGEHIEIIISENCSEDSSPKIIAEYAARDPRIRVFTQSSLLDVVDNFAFVLEKATGDFFCWAAHDDMRRAGAITKLAEVLEEHPEIACVMSDVLNLYEDSGQRTVDRLEGIRLGKVLSNWPCIRRLFFEVPTSNIFFCVYGLYRTEVLRRIELKMNLGFCANTEIPMLAQVALLGRIASIESEDFIYRRHSQSLYHRETANEAREIPFRRRTAIREALARMVGESSLSESEKVDLGRMLEESESKDQKGLRDLSHSVKAMKQGPAKVKREAPNGSGGPNIRRLLSRLKNRLLGRIRRKWTTEADRERRRNELQAIRREERRKERELQIKRKKGVLFCEADLANPDFELLIEQESERRRLAESGWSFSQSKRMRLILERGIATLLDCGANEGQYVDGLRKAGWNGRIYSFEPLREAYSKLRSKAEGGGGLWQAFPIALGDMNGESAIQIAGNSVSSSLLQFSDVFKSLRPDASPVGTETVHVRRLDDFLQEENLVIEGSLMLKLDVQGFELAVLRGAEETLKNVSLLQCELALIPSYEGAPTFSEVRDYLFERGFVLAHIIDGHSNHLTGELREVDGIFLNTRSALLPV